MLILLIKALSVPPFTRNVAAAVLHPEPVGRLPRVRVPRDRAVAGAAHAHRRHVLRLQHHPHQVGRQNITTGLKGILGPEVAGMPPPKMLRFAPSVHAVPGRQSEAKTEVFMPHFQNF